MKLFKLSLIDKRLMSYDCVWHFIVFAESEEQARLICSQNGACEIKSNNNPWLNNWESECNEVITPTNPGILSCYFRAG